LQNYTPSGGGSGGGTTYTAGDGIDIANNEISLETASANSIGGIKVGSGLSINANGVLSATGGSGGDAYYLKAHSIDKSFTCSNTDYLTDPTVSKEFIVYVNNGSYMRRIYKNGSTLAICAIANVNNKATAIFLSLKEDGVSSLHTNAGGYETYAIINSMGAIRDNTNNIDWYYSGNQ
jgi:hypothetical protein